MKEPSQEIGQLMDLASSGKEDAFGRLCEMIQDRLLRFARSRGLSEHDATDAVQETLLRAYSRLKRWRAGGNAVAWLMAIAANVVRETLRRVGGKQSRWLSIDAVLESGLATSEDDTQRRMLSERMIQLSDAIETLPERQKQAVAWRYLHGMDVAQTAALMSCAEGTVKATVSAGLENLRMLMREGRA